MSVALSVMFTGLCALIADGDGRPGEILLVNAKSVAEVSGASFPDHDPTLVMSLDDLANPESCRPTRVIAGAPSATGRVAQIALWDLRGAEVKIRAQGQAEAGVRFFRPGPDESAWPEPPRNSSDSAGWRDLRYVANMKALVGDGRIDPTLTGEDEAAAGQLPRHVAARVRLDAGLLQGSMPSQPTYREELFEFRGGTSSRGLRQAITDTIQWSMETAATAVVIEIMPVAGGEGRRLLLAPKAGPHRIFISNLPTANPTDASGHAVMNHQMTGAAHFIAYYSLLQNPPPDRPLPEVLRGVTGAKGTGYLRPVICPPAMFSRQ